MHYHYGKSIGRRLIEINVWRRLKTFKTEVVVYSLMRHLQRKYNWFSRWLDNSDHNKLLLLLLLVFSSYLRSTPNGIKFMEIKMLFNCTVIPSPNSVSGGFKGGLWGLHPPPSNKSSTYINIRFSRLVNVTIWLLIERFWSVWWK